MSADFPKSASTLKKSLNTKKFLKAASTHFNRFTAGNFMKKSVKNCDPATFGKNCLYGYYWLSETLF